MLVICFLFYYCFRYVLSPLKHTREKVSWRKLKHWADSTTRAACVCVFVQNNKYLFSKMMVKCSINRDFDLSFRVKSMTGISLRSFLVFFKAVRCVWAHYPAVNPSPQRWSMKCYFSLIRMHCRNPNQETLIFPPSYFLTDLICRVISFMSFYLYSTLAATNSVNHQKTGFHHLL